MAATSSPSHGRSWPSVRRMPGAEVEIEALDTSCVDGPATGHQALLDSQLRAEHDAMRDLHEAPSLVRLHHLRKEERGQRHPARFGHRSCGLATLGLPPITTMG